MTVEQADRIIAQNEQLIALWGDVLPLFGSFVHHVFPVMAVGLAALLGALLALAAVRA